MTSIEEPIAPLNERADHDAPRRQIGRTPLERIEYAIIVSTLLALVVMTVQPILNLLAVSFSDNARVPGMSGLTIIPEGFSLDVWTVLVNHPRVQQGMLNSLLITAAGVTINIVLTTLMAWGLARKGLPGRRTVYVLVLVTIVFEPGMLPDYFFNKQFGLIDSYWSVIMYKAVNAWYLIILVRFFEEIPEDLIDNGPRGRDAAGRPERGDRFERPERSSADRREGFEDSVWFRLNIGRHQNADPRWILPLLCRRGHVSKNEIGAIRIGPKETMFNIPRAIADRFAEAVVRTANQDGEDDSGVSITPAPDGPTYPPRRDKGSGDRTPRSTLGRAPGGERSGPRGPRGPGRPGGPAGNTERYKPKPYGQRSPRRPSK